MDTKWAIVAILTLLKLASGDDMSSADVVNIKEGSTGTIICKGEHNETIRELRSRKDIHDVDSQRIANDHVIYVLPMKGIFTWYVAWAVTMENGSRQPIAYFYNTDEDSPECNKENVVKGISNCSMETELDDFAFTSQLTLWNVTPSCRHAFVECIMADEHGEMSGHFWVMKSYNLSVYHLSYDVKCRASLDANHVIHVSCEASQVYPDIVCRIFLQLQRNVSQLESKSDVTMSELSNVTQFKKRLERNVDYYQFSCAANYYPTEPGRYQFRVVMYPINDPVNPIANITTNSLEVNGKGVYYTKHQKNQETTASLSEIEVYYKKHNEETTAGLSEIEVYYKKHNEETAAGLSAINQAFYTLIGSILIFGVSVFIIISWIVWRKRSRCFPPPSATTESHEYASINDTGADPSNLSPALVSLPDEGYGESAGGDVVSHAEADEDTLPQKLLEERGYVPNVTVPKAHIRASTANVYIDPITPTSTLSRSIEERHERDSSISDDNDNETHSKAFL